MSMEKFKYNVQTWQESKFKKKGKDNVYVFSTKIMMI